MIEKYTILKFAGEEFVTDVFSSEKYSFEIEIYGDDFRPQKNTFYLIVFTENKITERAKKLFSVLSESGAKFIIVTSFISFETALELNEFTPYVIFMPMSLRFLYRKIDDILCGVRPEDGAIFRNETFQQFENISQLQKIFLYFYRSDMIIREKVCNISEKPLNDGCSRKTIINAARKALAEGHFKMYFQPVVNILENRLTGFESLIRWIDPERGLICPDEFIPVVETSDFIFELTYWIIEDVIKFIFQLNREIKEGLRINVNICAKHFHLEELADTIELLRKKYKISAEQIGIEITESAFMDDMEIANLNLLKLKSMHYPLYMDDFGTGYSSLSYLQHFPVEIIKIDKSFVAWMHVDEQSELIVKSIIALAHGMNMKVVAEGIEEESHVRLLGEYGCEYGQGYYYSPPLDKKGVMSFINEFGT